MIPEPETLLDDYATRPAALPENHQTIARDLCRTDLKLEPPAELTGRDRNSGWRSHRPPSPSTAGRSPASHS